MPLDPAKILAVTFPAEEVKYTWRDAVLYALGVGFGMDPMDADQLKFVDETKLVAVPTLANVLGHPGSWLRDRDCGVDWVNAVHGEQELILHRSLPSEGVVRVQVVIDDVIDKGPGRGAIILVRRELADPVSGTAIATVHQGIFCRGSGGFGGRDRVGRADHDIPRRDPDISISMPTHPQLALVYRLSGDFNPLHSDPTVAKAAGYDRPILHGLSTFGLCSHALLKGRCGYDVERFQSMTGRFSAPVYPGETIRLEAWSVRPGLDRFRATVVGRPAVAMTNGVFRFRS